MAGVTTSRIKATSGADLLGALTTPDALVVVADGLLLRGAPNGRSAMLFGPVDMLPTAPSDDGGPGDWRVLVETTVVVISGHPAPGQMWPPQVRVLLDNVALQLHRNAELVAIAHLAHADERILALMWHLADRFGRVGTEGVVVPIPMPHVTIASLVGARRPTVTLALAALDESGALRRRPSDAHWVLAPDSRPPS